MSTKPRDVDSYLTALTDTINNIDPSLDISKGAAAVLMYAAAVVGSQTEVQAAYLQTLYRLDDVDGIDDEDIFSLGLNFGLDPNRGIPARGLVYFYTTVPPEEGTVKKVENGYIVSTSDSRYNFLVVESAEMSSDNASAYYNSTEKRYEVPVSVIAEAVGDDFNLPPGVINTIQTTQEDWDGVINKDYMRQGTDPLDKYQFRNLIWNAQQGLNQSTVGNMITTFLDINPVAFDDISVVSSSDLDVFKRIHKLEKKMGYDVYIISDSTKDAIQSGIANGGETYIQLEKQPVLSVVYVLVDGVQVPFSLEKETDEAWKESAKATDKITLSTPLQPAQTYEIRYLYYDLIQEGQEAIEAKESIFGADVLLRLAETVDIFIEATAYAISTINPEDVVAEIESFTAGYLRDPDNPSSSVQLFVDRLDPYHYQQAIEANIDGLSHFRLTKFVRTDRAWLDIEEIALDGVTQYPTLSINSIFSVK